MTKRRKRDDVLQDGETLRVTMMMKDHASVRRARISDAGDTPNALHRPGYRIAQPGSIITDAASELQQSVINRAYQSYEDDLKNAWRDGGEINPDRSDDPEDDDDEDEDEEDCSGSAFGGSDPKTEGAGLKSMVGQQVADLCTIDEKSGTWQRRGGKLVCVPSSGADSRAKLDELYSARDEALSQEWKK
jgi:hypothetical protein